MTESVVAYSSRTYITKGRRGKGASGALRVREQYLRDDLAESAFRTWCVLCCYCVRARPDSSCCLAVARIFRGTPSRLMLLTFYFSTVRRSLCTWKCWNRANLQRQT